MRPPRQTATVAAIIAAAAPAALLAGCSPASSVAHPAGSTVPANRPRAIPGTGA